MGGTTEWWVYGWRSADVEENPLFWKLTAAVTMKWTMNVSNEQTEVEEGRSCEVTVGVTVMED